MSDQPEGQQITEQDVTAVTERFKQWITTLPEDQQRVFGWILTRAAAADNADAANYGLEAGSDVPLSQLMHDAAGLAEREANADVVGMAMSGIDIDPIPVWTYKW